MIFADIFALFPSPAPLPAAKGIKGKDAVHVACALFADADFFITPDYKLTHVTQNSKK